MQWHVIFQPDNLALFGNGIVTTLWLLFASLAWGGVMALIFALLLTGPWAPLVLRTPSGTEASPP